MYGAHIKGMPELEWDDRSEGAGNIFTDVPVRRPRRQQEADWKRAIRLVAHALGAVVFLAAGTVWTLRQVKPKFARPGEMLRLPPALITAQRPGTEGYVPGTNAATDAEISRVTHVLRKYTKDSVKARRIATAMVYEGGRKNISPTLLIGVLLTEDATLDTRARSSVGARGLMQIMPFHAGEWKKDCGPSADLYDIGVNVCHGVAILASYMKRSPNLERALLRYNGCVRGTNTPHCHTYSGKVLRYAEKAASQMLNFSISD